MMITAYDLAQRYIGIRELAGDHQHPLIQWWLSLCGFALATPDEVPWCAAFVNGIAWELRLPRSKSAAARSWLTVGRPVALMEAEVGYDVVILSRGEPPQPPATVIAAPGHVGFFAGLAIGNQIELLGGNQHDGVCVEAFPIERVLGLRRLQEP